MACLRRLCLLQETDPTVTIAVQTGAVGVEALVVVLHLPDDLAAIRGHRLLHLVDDTTRVHAHVRDHRLCRALHLHHLAASALLHPPVAHRLAHRLVCATSALLPAVEDVLPPIRRRIGQETEGILLSKMMQGQTGEEGNILKISLDEVAVVLRQVVLRCPLVRSHQGAGVEAEAVTSRLCRVLSASPFFRLSDMY